MALHQYKIQLIYCFSIIILIIICTIIHIAAFDDDYYTIVLALIYLKTLLLSDSFGCNNDWTY